MVRASALTCHGVVNVTWYTGKPNCSNATSRNLFCLCLLQQCQTGASSRISDCCRLCLHKQCHPAPNDSASFQQMLDTFIDYCEISEACLSLTRSYALHLVGYLRSISVVPKCSLVLGVTLGVTSTTTGVAHSIW